MGARVGIWTPTAMQIAKECCAASETIAEAHALFVKRTGHDVSHTAFRMAFRDRSEGSPGQYLGKPIASEDSIEGAVASGAPTTDTRPSSSRESVGRIRRTTERILFIPDVHVPFEDARAFDLMMAVARALRPETIVILGDFADMWAVSAHDKSPTRRDNLESEMKAVSLRLDEIDSIGAKRKVYCEGNHEERLTRHISRQAPELFQYVQFPKIQRLDERGWQWVPYREHHKIGRIFVTHDLGEAGMYAHSRARATMGGNVVIGHVHRMGVAYASTAEGTGHVSAAFGWLGDAEQAKYLPAAKRAAWQLGFGIGYMEPSGNVHLAAIPIVDYRCVVEGSLFEAAAKVAA